MKKNISSNNALRITLRQVGLSGDERVDLSDALGRVLAEDVAAEIDLPFADVSSRDGFAFRSGDSVAASPAVPALLKVKRTVFAEDRGGAALKKGEAVSIMTGARLPRGADAVIPVEEVRRLEGMVIALTRPVPPGTFVRKKGTEIRARAVALRSGCILRPAEIGFLAALGRNCVRVCKRPVVGILSTGSELADPRAARRSAVNDCNSYFLSAQVRQCGAIPKPLGIAADTPAALEKKLRRGLACDAVIVSGGVSRGKKDLLLSLLNGMGGSVKFWWVKIVPGRPFALAVLKKRPIFCLPGTPATALVVFEKFVRPALRKMMGCRRLGRYRLMTRVAEKIELNGGRTHFLRVKVREKNGVHCAYLAGSQVPVMLKSIVACDGLMEVPATVSCIMPGELYPVEILD